MSLALAITAYLVFAVASVALAVIDARTHRLPNRIVLPTWASCALLLAASAALSGSGAALTRALVASLALFTLFLLARLASPRGMGGGDVKLAGVVGLLLGWLGWEAVVIGALAGFVLAGVYGLVLIAARRASAKTAIAFGPFMLAGAWLVVGTSALAG